MFTGPSRFQEDYAAKYDEPRHHVETLLNAKIITLDIKPRILYPLDNRVSGKNRCMKNVKMNVKSEVNDNFAA